MAYSELIKSFEKIRDYMRGFYVYGFRSRDEYAAKSARSYDDERRRIESWLGGYMGFRQTAEGKRVFITVDNRSVPFNPLYNAWKAKSFTDKDIVLHFCILAALADGAGLGVKEIADAVAERLSHTDAPFEMDESTVRNKLREYTELGVLVAEKKGRALSYRLAEDGVDLPAFADALAFFSEEAPLGVIGSYLLDRVAEPPQYFRSKHHYLIHALDTQVLYAALCAMRDKRCVDITNFNARKSEEHAHRVCPLRIYVSTQTGREYLLGYHYRFHRPMFFRLDLIRSVTPGPIENHYGQYEAYAASFDEKLWGVSTGGDYTLSHVEMTIRAEEGEEYILERLEREKRHGRVEIIDEHTFRFVADVYDAGEVLMWARSFLGRVVRFESSDPQAVERFYADIRRMTELYEEGAVL